VRGVKRFLAIAGALAAGAALGAVGLAALAGGDEGAPPLRIDPDRDLERLIVAPATDPPREALRGNRGQQLDFFQTEEPFVIAAGTEEGATLPCPKGYKAINGYYVSGQPGTLLGLSAPQLAVEDTSGAGAKPSKRNWVIAVFNTTAADDQVIFGVACLNKVK